MLFVDVVWTNKVHRNVCAVAMYGQRYSKAASFIRNKNPIRLMVLLDGPLCCMLNQPPETKKQISNQSSQIHGIRSNMSVTIKSLHASIYVASTDTTTQNAREWEHSMHNNVVHVFHACLMMLASRRVASVKPGLHRNFSIVDFFLCGRSKIPQFLLPF